MGVVALGLGLAAVAAVIVVLLVRRRRRAQERDQEFIDVTDRLLGTGADPAVLRASSAVRLPLAGATGLDGPFAEWARPSGSKPQSDTVVFEPGSPTLTRRRPHRTTVTHDDSREPGEATIELSDEGEAVIVLGGRSQREGIEHIAHELASEVGISEEDLAQVTAELSRRPSAGLAEAAALLAELVDDEPPDDSSEADPFAGSELVLLSGEAPRRPGRFADLNTMSPAERRRIIIRVLCLLVAQDDETDTIDLVAGERRSVTWEGPPPGVTPKQLPSRRAVGTDAGQPAGRH
jgi:hypothetical protein